MTGRRACLLLTVGALASAYIPAAAQAASPLIGQWSLDSSFEDGASDVTADSSGNGLDLRAPVGSVHLGSPALFGTGATLGTNLTPAQVTSALLAPAQVTLLAWIKQNGNPGTLRYIAGQGDDGLICGGSTYALYSGYPAKPGLRFYARTAGAPTGALTDAPADGALFNGQWHLVAGTYDGAAARLYVDGVLVGSPVAAPPPLLYALGGGSSFYVDGYPVEACALGPNADDWPGPIDEVRVYDRALSASELARLATAAGPTAPALVSDASLIPPPAPPPAPPAPRTTAKVVERTALASAVAGVSGAARQAPTAAAQAALAAVQGQGLAAMRNAVGSSRVAPPQTAQELSAKQVKATNPDPRVQNRLEAMEYGVATQVPAAATGQIVEAVATIVLERKSGGVARTQTIVLPPAVGVAEGASNEAALQFAVDRRATAAITKDDVAKAAMSVQAVAVDARSDLGEQQALKLQTALGSADKATATLTNVLKKLAQTEQAIRQNLKGGVTGPERSEQQQLNAKADKLDQQAKAIEKGMQEANQKATQAMQQAVTALVTGIAAGTTGIGGGALPTASTSLGGCKICQFGALPSN